MQVVKQSVKLERYTDNPEELIVSAARTCYQSKGSDIKRMIEMLISKGHLSPLEHASATFRITTDRAIANQLVRHRIASYSQESTRYCKYDKGIRFIRPLGMCPTANMYFESQCSSAETAYSDMLKVGEPPEVARDVLPLCTATEIVATMNFRAWWHFLEERLAQSAHPKMRELAEMIAVKLYKIAPHVFGEVEISLEELPSKIDCPSRV